MGMIEKLSRRFGYNPSTGQCEVESKILEAEVPEALAVEGAGVFEQDIALDLLTPDPDQPRKHFDVAELADLSQSLKRQQLNPLRVRYREDLQKYQLISGERRYRAAVQGEMRSLRCVVIDRPLTDEEVLEEQLVDDMLRAPLRPVEQGEAFKKLMRLKGITEQKELAAFLCISQATVSKALSLCEQPAPVRQLVAEGTLAPTVAYELGKIKDPEGQTAVANLAAEEEWSVKRAREEVAGILGRVRETERTFGCGDAEVVVRFPRPAELLEIVAALERALAQAKQACADAGGAA